jgi:hypothetical protein
VHGLSGLIPIAPVVRGADAVGADIEVLRVVDVLVGPRLDAVDDARLEVDQDGPRDVPRVVALVVEDVFAVAAFGREVLEVAVLVYAVLLAELLPELAADFTPRSVAGFRVYGSRRTTYCCCRTGRLGWL